MGMRISKQFILIEHSKIACNARMSLNNIHILNIEKFYVEIMLFVLFNTVFYNKYFTLIYSILI